ncbi:hypothetical protein KCU95_g11718, partial [Aureobasidium melanogenum]
MSTTKKLKRHYFERDSSSEDEIQSRKRTHLPKRTCFVCEIEKRINHFPNHKQVSSHEHDHNVCEPCYRSHLENEIDSKSWNEVACPECSITLTYKEVKTMTTARNFAKYEQACIRATLAADPDFRYCLSTTCKSGQLHPGGTDEPIFRCEHCGHKHCIVCEANWHQDQTCEDFQALRQRLHAENERSQQEVKKLSKPCPGCSVPIQKDRGCDHMTCSRCHHQFCWLCAVDYDLIIREGNHHHEEDCKHYRAILRADIEEDEEDEEAEEVEEEAEESESEEEEDEEEEDEEEEDQRVTYEALSDMRSRFRASLLDPVNEEAPAPAMVRRRQGFGRFGNLLAPRRGQRVARRITRRA